MPNGFWYASGCYSTEQAAPASAFSKGDLLMLTSDSSLSRLDPVSADKAVGVALCDSTQSIAGKVPYLVPGADALFWASLATNASAATAGTYCDVHFSTANNRYYVVPTSASTARAIIVRGTDEVDQSVQSKVLCKLIYHDGDLVYS